MHCRICGNLTANQGFQAREMMLGRRDAFDYFACSGCGCLQIAEFPPSMARYYPPNYFGVRAASSPIPPWAYTMFEMPEVMALARTLPRAELVQTLVGRAVTRYLPDLPTDARILDVGCGTGSFLHALHSLGYRHLAGVDRFIPQSLSHPSGVSVRKGTIHDLLPAPGAAAAQWDAILFHHSFEHLSDPLDSLRAVARLLAPGGFCLIRIPVGQSAAWERYGVDWVQLDAPRHFFLHTPTSIAHLADQAGLRLDRHFCDSSSFQFYGSELYRQNVPLSRANPGRAFTPDQFAAFAAEAAQLNASGRGDQAAFYLTPSGG
jgi:SAM-dependent methyltransferase